MPEPVTPEEFAAGLEKLAAAALKAADDYESLGSQRNAGYWRGRHDTYTACATEVRNELAPAHAALTGQLAVMTAARDDLARELDKALADVADAEKLAGAWPKCPDGCGCRLNTEDADAAECGCDGPCGIECRENGYPDAPSYRDLAVTRLKADLDSARTDDAELSRALMAVVGERDAWRDELATIHEMIAGPIDDPEHLAETTPRVAGLITERDRFRATLEEIRDSSAASTLTLQAIAVKGLEGGRG